MKRSKPTNSPAGSSQPDAKSRAHLREVQRLMAGALFRPLTPRWRMAKTSPDGADLSKLAETFIKPNDRLTSFERLEIYSRSYWFRVLDCLYDDYPGLRAVLGERKFMKLAAAYLAKYPSRSFTLRNLGDRLESFLREEPHWAAPRLEMALDMARFEWAQVVAFDGPSRPQLTPDDLLETSPAHLRLALQPYVSLLELTCAVDHFLLAIKKRDADVLRSEASNTVDAAPKIAHRRKPIRLPKRERVHLAVHRLDNMLYYKRLEPEAFAILTALSRGATVETACMSAIDSSERVGTDWPAQIKEWFATWSEFGWLCRFSGRAH